MTRWTQEQDDLLRELAADGLSAAEIARAMPDRSESAVYGRAAKLKARLSAGNYREMRDYLSGGGCLVRDEVGGVVGVRWARATRSGESYPTRTCERLAALGWLRPHQFSANVYQWAPT